MLQCNYAYVFVRDAEQKQKLVEMAHALQSEQAVRVMQLDSSLDPSTSLDLSEEKSRHYLFIAEPDFAARGVDVRSPKKKTTLILATLFRHMTQYKQACFRVGRQRDPCARVIFEDIWNNGSPVDPATERTFDKQLNTAIAERNRQE